MGKQGKITKSEIFLLAVTLVFLALVLILHFSGRSGNAQSGYTVRTWQGNEVPEREIAPVDVNTADVSQLQQLPGIGPALAERIVADRTANGPFTSLDELTRVDGIGEKTVEALRLYATAGSAEQEEIREDPGS